jgi:hypothetical protein
LAHTLTRGEGQEAAELFAVACLLVAAGEAGKQLAHHGAAQKQLIGMAYHFHTGGITAFEAGIGVGVEGDRSHPSLPQLWVHLFQRGDGRLESIGLVLAPGARKGIKVVMGSCGVVAAAREALKSQFVQTDALPLGFVLEILELLGFEAPHADGCHELLAVNAIKPAMVASGGRPKSMM